MRPRLHSCLITTTYYFKVISFELNNADTTYEKLMDAIFSNMIGCNLEIYIEDMVIKTSEEGNHCADLDDIFKSIMDYNI